MGALLVTVMLSLSVLAPLAWVPFVGLCAVILLDAMISVRVQRQIVWDAPLEVFVGEEARLSLTDPRRSAGQRVRFDWPEGLSGPRELAFASDTLSVRVRAKKRGAYELAHLWLLWPSRLGLVEFVPRIPLGATLKVVPNIRPAQSGALNARVASTLIGIKENRALGAGSEFHQLREFTTGMDVKTIDWKRTARARTLLAKELHAERNHNVILALDTGYLMREEIDGLAKIDHAITASLAVAWAAALGGDVVGHFAYDVRPGGFAKPMEGRKGFLRLRSFAASLAYTARETNHTLGLTELNRRTPKRSLIVIFTDFVDTTTAELMLENLALLARRHLILFVALRDPEVERRLARTPEDLDDVATYVATHQAMAERRLVLERLSRMGATIIDAEPAQVTGRLISAYLDIKERELI